MAKARTTAMARTVLPLMALMLASSCTGDTMWHRFAHVDARGWHANDTLCFTLPPARADGMYDMDIELRTTPAYPYRSLTLAREMLLSHPDTAWCDTVEIETSTNGRDLTGQGLTLQSFVQPATPFHLSKGQQAQVRIVHIMSRGTMPDITDVGVCVKAGK